MNSTKRYKTLCILRDRYIDSPRTELIYRSSFELLISVLLSAQTSDFQVNKVTHSLFKVANTPKKMLCLGIEGIKNHIKSIGLFNIKSKNIISICDILIQNYNNIIPKNRKALESLPGVGRKTANIVLNLIFGWPTIAVDTHVFRICNRTCFAPGKNVLSVEKRLLKVVPKEFKKQCHQWLVLHGKFTCRSKLPFCFNCIIKDLCEFKQKSIEK